MLIVDLFICVNCISDHWSWNLSLCVSQIFCGPYPNQTYGFSPPTVFGKFVARVPIGCSDLFTSIDWFVWYKRSFKLFVQVLFFWFLNCAYWIYWASVNLSWNLSLCVLANCLWDVVCGRLWLRWWLRDLTCLHQLID